MSYRHLNRFKMMTQSVQRSSCCARARGGSPANRHQNSRLRVGRRLGSMWHSGVWSALDSGAGTLLSRRLPPDAPSTLGGPGSKGGRVPRKCPQAAPGPLRNPWQATRTSASRWLPGPYARSLIGPPKDPHVPSYVLQGTPFQGWRWTTKKQN